MIKKCVLVFMLVLVILVRFEPNLNFFDKISKKKISNAKFHENPSSRSRVVCGRTHRQTEMTKVLVAFPSIVKVPKTGASIYAEKY